MTKKDSKPKTNTCSTTISELSSLNFQLGFLLCEMLHRTPAVVEFDKMSGVENMWIEKIKDLTDKIEHLKGLQAI